MEKGCVCLPFLGYRNRRQGRATERDGLARTTVESYFRLYKYFSARNTKVNSKCVSMQIQFCRRMYTNCRWHLLWVCEVRISVSRRAIFRMKSRLIIRVHRYVPCCQYNWIRCTWKQKVSLEHSLIYLYSHGIGAKVNKSRMRHQHVLRTSPYFPGPLPENPKAHSRLENKIVGAHGRCCNTT